MMGDLGSPPPQWKRKTLGHIGKELSKAAAVSEGRVQRRSPECGAGPIVMEPFSSLASCPNPGRNSISQSRILDTCGKTFPTNSF